jgi:exopolyphosphatase/guanosine-5'-triphosphate,3'-diphosphate pyrophosphatase
LNPDRIGVIDVGTNSILALGIDRSGTILFNDYQISELGQGMAQNDGNLRPEKIDHAFLIIDSFVTTMREMGIETFKIVGTSASRDAKNISKLIEMLKTELNVDYDIISGDEEAYFTYLGALSLFDDPKDEPCVMMDIGGGSTEVIYGNGFDIEFKHSFQLGVIRLKEAFQKMQLDETFKEDIREHLISFYSTIPKPNQPSSFIGIGGTFTTVAAIYREFETYDPNLVNGLVLSYEDCENIYLRLNAMTIEERKSVKGLEFKRASLIHFGLRIILDFMDYFSIKSVHFTDFGLRFGVAKNYFKNA